MRNFKVSLMVKLVVGSGVLTTILVIVFFLFLNPLFNETIDDLTKSRTKLTSEIGYSIVLNYYNECKRGIIKESEAKRLALETLRNMKFMGDEYFWVNDYKYIMLMHPFSSELEGKNLETFKDPNGVSLFRDFVKIAKTKNEGFVYYSWQRPKSKLPIQKISYVKGFKEWNMIIGSGAYIDDINLVKKQIFYGLVIAFIVLLAFILIIMIYLTNRKYIEKELIEKEENLRTTLYSIGECVITTDINGNITRINSVAQKLTGWSSKDAFGKELTQVFKIVSAQTREVMTNPVMKVLETGSIIGLANHTLLISKDGSEYQISDSASPIRDYNNKVSGVVLVFKDVTAEYKKQEILFQTKNMLELVMNNIPQFIFWKDRNSVYLGCNQNFAKAAGVESPEDIIGKIDHELNWTKEESDFYRLCDERVMRSGIGEYHIIETQLQSNGKKAWVDTNKIPLFDGGQNVIGILGTYEDITERKQYETKILASENRLKSILRAAPTGIGVINNKVFTRLNPKVCEMTGYHFAEIIGKSCQDIYPSHEEYEKANKNLFRQMSELGTGVVETRWIKKNGEKIDVLLATTHLDLNDKTKGITFTALDITHQKKHQELLIKQNQQLEQQYEEYMQLNEVLRQTNYNLEISKEKVEESEHFLKETQLIARLGTYTFDIASGIWDGSEILDSIFGIESNYSKSIEGWINIIHPDWQKVMNDYLIQEVIGNRTKFDKEYKIIRQNDKAERWVHGFGDLRCNEINIPTTMIGTILDITERKLADIEILKLSQAVEQSPVSIVITDKDGNIEYGNQKVAEISGYSLDELIGKNPRIFRSGETSKSEYQNLWETISSGKEWFGEFHNKKKNGELYWDAASISPILNEKGEITHYVAVKEDITERKHAEEKLRDQNHQLEKQYEEYMQLNDVLRQTNYDLEISKEKVEESETKLKDMIDNMQDAFFQTDLDGNFSFVNNSAIKMFGFSSPYEMIGLPAAKLFAIPIEREIIIKELKIFEKLFDQNGMALRKDGTTFWVSMNLQYIKDKDSNVIGIQGVVRDISDRKKAEEELVIAKERAVESDRLKTAFLQNISHEIITPLNGILGFSKLISNYELSQDEKNEYIGLLEYSSRRLMNTINDILDISRIDTQQIDIQKRECSPTEIIYSMLDSYQVSFYSKEIEFIINIDPIYEHISIISDEKSIMQILNSFLSNAEKFTISGKVEIGFSISNKIIVFYVKDTGIGISEESLERIFDRFYQTDLSITRGYEGTGLGLSIAKGLSSLLGGKVWADSEVGIGSTFYFSLNYN